MKQQNNTTPSINVNETLDLICYNLAQYQYLVKRYQLVQNLTDFDTFLNIATERAQKYAQTMRYQLGELKKGINQENNPHLKKYYEMEFDRLIKQLPYNVYRIADNKSLAKLEVRKAILMGDFEIVLASQKENARSYDSAGRLNLYNRKAKVPVGQRCYGLNYTVFESFFPIWDTNQLGLYASQEKVSVLASRSKPSKPVYHQIWINDDLMVRATFLTDKSFFDYLSKNKLVADKLFYMIAFAQQIYQKLGKNCSQKMMDAESKKMRMEYAKRQGENLLEQFNILAIETFCMLVQKLKQDSVLANNTDIFENVNKIKGLTQPFSTTEIQQMQQYLTIRNQLAHPMEYNFRPMGDKTNSANDINYMTNFVLNMSKYLAKLLNKDEIAIQQKIQSIKEEDFTASARMLILLMDARKALRDICVKQANLNPNQPNIFLKLGMITADENKKLADAVELRNTLCHTKMDKNLAQKAQDMYGEVFCIVEKISDNIERKYQTGLYEYYPNQKTVQNEPIDFEKMYPFLTVSVDNDPDKDVFLSAFQYKQSKNKEKLNPQILQDLYLFAITFQEMCLSGESLNDNSYYEVKDLEPYIMFINKALQLPSQNIRRKVLNGIVCGWMSGCPIPVSKQHTKA